MPRQPKKFRPKPPRRESSRRGPAGPRKPAPTPEGDNAASPREGERLQKVLAAAGIASRRECEQLILEGRVQVDGQVVSELGARVDREAHEIRVDGEPLPRPRLQYFAVHKPAGVVSTARDPAGRPRVIDLLPPGAGRMFNVGRLDLASEGLILVTNDGLLANQLTHPKHGVEKVYEVQVAGLPEPDVLAQIKRGVHLSEGFVHAVDVRIKRRKKGSTLLEMVLGEGRNREIRRLLARVGHKVQRLTRVAVGPIRLGDMPRGAVRQLTPEEVRKLRAAAAAGPRPERSDARPSGRPPRKSSGPHPNKSRGGAGGRHRAVTGERQEVPSRRIIGEDRSAGRPSGATGKGKPPKRLGRRPKPGGPAKRGGR